MLYKTQSAALYGIDAYVVQVEVDISPGSMGHFTTVAVLTLALGLLPTVLP